MLGLQLLVITAVHHFYIHFFLEYFLSIVRSSEYLPTIERWELFQNLNNLFLERASHATFICTRTLRRSDV